jgi:citrate lyase subunit beta/citryl-CoA lyase
VVIDLEDAVAPEAKARARQSIGDWLGERPRVDVWLRINAHGSEWFDDDVALVRRAAPAGVMLAKAEGADAVRAIGGGSVIALVESARGIAQLAEIAQAPGVVRLAFGSIDFQADVGIPGEGEALLAFRSALVLASRLAELAPPIDGVTPAIDDAGALRADARRARDLGFGGKLCIHPKQVGPVREAFMPTAAEVAWAERVLGAAAAGGAALQVDGRMVDRPVLLRAQAILDAR